jgi:aminocarboxymuconate-semialdehyde decarboxylase
LAGQAKREAPRLHLPFGRNTRRVHFLSGCEDAVFIGISFADVELMRQGIKAPACRRCHVEVGAATAQCDAAICASAAPWICWQARKQHRRVRDGKSGEAPGDYRLSYPRDAPGDGGCSVLAGRCPMTIENVFEAAKAGSIDKTVISNPAHELRRMTSDQQLATIQMINRYLASLANKHDNIYAMATGQPYGGDKFLRETERAVREDGAKAVIILSSLPGHYPDDDDALPFFELVASLDVPVFVHPPSVGFGEERHNIYRLASSVGRPMDGALAIARLIVRGVFEKFPQLKLVASHLGGGICEMIGRYFLGPYELMLIKHPTSHYLKMMYIESTCYWAPGARCALDSVGADHFIFGTDAPPLKPLKKAGVEIIKSPNLSPADEAKVFSQNARRLLKI